MTLKLGIFGLEEHFPYIESGIKQAREIFDIVGIVDNYDWNRERRDALAAEFATPVMKDWKQLIDAGAQLITLCTINNEKGPVICECLKQGIHVVTDKPTVATRADYEAVKAVSANSPKTVLTPSSQKSPTDCFNHRRRRRLLEQMNATVSLNTPKSSNLPTFPLTITISIWYNYYHEIRIRQRTTLCICSLLSLSYVREI